MPAWACLYQYTLYWLTLRPYNFPLLVVTPPLPQKSLSVSSAWLYNSPVPPPLLAPIQTPPHGIPPPPTPQASSSQPNLVAMPVQVLKPNELFYSKIIPLLKASGLSEQTPRKDWPHTVQLRVLEELMKETPSELLAKYDCNLL